MAKLYRRQDGGYYTRTYMGVTVTKQVHIDAVRYLNNRGVTVGDEIPTQLMDKLRNTQGWLYTKYEMLYGGPKLPQIEVDVSNECGSGPAPSRRAKAKRRKLSPEEKLAKAQRELQTALDDLEKVMSESAEVDPSIIDFYRKHRPSPPDKFGAPLPQDLLFANKAELQQSDIPIHTHKPLLIVESSDQVSRFSPANPRAFNLSMETPNTWSILIVVFLIIVVAGILGELF